METRKVNIERALIWIRPTDGGSNVAGFSLSFSYTTRVLSKAQHQHGRDVSY